MQMLGLGKQDGIYIYLLVKSSVLFKEMMNCAYKCFPEYTQMGGSILDLKFSLLSNS